MTIQEVFDLGLKMGTAADPRGKKGVEKYLERRKKEFEGLSDKKKKYFDEDSLKNPYADSRILAGDPKKQVKTVLVGIDMNIGEVLLADRLGEKGTKIDLVITHHPEGHALSALHEVMDLQIDTLAALGMPVNVAEQLMSSRIQDVERKIHPANHAQAIDAAELLDIPLVAMHTIWDNMGHTFMQDYLDGKDLETVGEVMETVMDVEEFQLASKLKEGPYVGAGSEKNRAGKIHVGFTGGTDGPKDLYEHISRLGVGTLVDMHLSLDHLKEAKKYHMNAIVTGHMSSDSIGANLFLDELEKNGITVIPCSGLMRVKRQ